MSIKDSIRSAILSGVSAKFKTEIVEVEGNKVELRQPSQEARKEIFEKAKNADKELDGFELMVWSVIFNTYEPGGEKIFEEADYKTLMGLPAGGVVDKLGEAAVKLLNVDETIEKKYQG